MYDDKMAFAAQLRGYIRQYEEGCISAAEMRAAMIRTLDRLVTFDPSWVDEVGGDEVALAMIMAVGKPIQ